MPLGIYRTAHCDSQTKPGLARPRAYSHLCSTLQQSRAFRKTRRSRPRLACSCCRTPDTKETHPGERRLGSHADRYTTCGIGHGTDIERGMPLDGGVVEGG